MDTQGKILIIEDDADIRQIEEIYLQSMGYATISQEDGEDVMTVLGSEQPDLILLDLMLPGRNGYEICAEVREHSDIPILMVTARGEPLDKIRGFNCGVDDYIVKPFDTMELTARVGANIRQYRRIRENAAGQQAEGGRSMGAAVDGSGVAGGNAGMGADAAPREIVIGKRRIQPDTWRAYRGEEELHLTNKEFELLRFLAQNPNIVFSKEQLMEHIWGYDYAGDGATVMVHVGRLRDKIEEDPRNPQLLETVWGAGYRLNR